MEVPRLALAKYSQQRSYRQSLECIRLRLGWIGQIQAKNPDSGSFGFIPK